MEKRLPLPVGTVLQNRYRILRQLGHGGFGAVYEAVDDEINLAFALKETFYAADEDLRSAFKREARMLASLSHEAFPRVSHYFTEGDGCFLVMELVRGDDLDKLLSRRAAPFDEAQVLQWAEQILDALEDLHAGGIIHRDIKPSNLKLTPKGKIKLLDFGIAKGSLEGETTILTTVGSLAAATLQYAPLEQVLKASPQHQMMLSVVSSDRVVEFMNRRTIPASDLYALAATLYHLLTKTLPADAPTRALAIWSGQNDRLIPARQINPQISTAVSGILQKAMHLDSDARFQTAAEMRQILREPVKLLEITEPPTIVQNEIPPTQAFPAGIYPTEQVTEIRPKPLNIAPVIAPPATVKPKSNIVWYALLGAIPVIFGFGILVFLLTRSGGIVPSNNPTFAANKTNSNIAAANTNAGANLKTPAASVEYELAQTLPAQNDQVQKIIYSPDGRTFASKVAGDNVIKIWDAASGNLKLSINGGFKGDTDIAYSPDGKTIAIAGVDNYVKFWDTADGKLKSTLNFENLTYDIAYSPDGRTLATNYVTGVKLYSTTTGKITLKFDETVHRYSAIAYSPDGKILATGRSGGIILWDAETGKPLRNIEHKTDFFQILSFTPDGKIIAFDAGGTDIELWDTETGTLKNTLKYSGNQFIAFSPDGRFLATASENDSENAVKIWDIEVGNLVRNLKGHSKTVEAGAFSPDGRAFVSGSQDKTVKIWRLK